MTALSIVPVHLDNHDLMGFKIGNKYFYGETLAMGYGLSCQLFEFVS